MSAPRSACPAYTLDGQPVNIVELVGDELEHVDPDDVRAIVDLRPGEEMVVAFGSNEYVLRRER